MAGRESGGRVPAAAARSSQPYQLFARSELRRPALAARGCARSSRQVALEVDSHRRRTVMPNRQPAPELLAAGSTVVYSVGRSIYTPSARRRIPRLVARTAATPIGLSVVGRGVAWAENTSHGSRLRAVMLQR